MSAVKLAHSNHTWVDLMIEFQGEDWDQHLFSDSGDVSGRNQLSTSQAINPGILGVKPAKRNQTHQVHVVMLIVIYKCFGFSI